MRVLCGPLFLFFILTTLSTFTTIVYGSVTVYKPSSTPLSSSSPAAFNDTVLQPPSPPLDDLKPPSDILIALPMDSSGVSGLSIPQTCAFWGFSIEMSVVPQVLGKNSRLLQVPFLNLLETIAQRAGCVRVRTGGNTQEFARYTDSLPKSSRSNDPVIIRQSGPSQNPTETPPLLYNLDYFYLLGNISALVNIGWFLGIPLNDTSSPIPLEIAEYGQKILGDRLLGLQVGNEPDLYADHSHRLPSYSPSDYFQEFGLVSDVIRADSKLGPLSNDKLIGPNVATGSWTPEMVWDTGFIDAYNTHTAPNGLLGALAVEHYPDDNCFAMYGGSVGHPKDPQALFSSYLNHTSAVQLVSAYTNSSLLSLRAGLPLYMFETNSASCGGFPGISDSFGSALWALDYGLQMAWANFSAGMIHVGGRNVYYNPFTPPSTNESTFRQWTVGSTFYSALVIAEVFGSSNKSRIWDVPQPSIYQPQYAIYEDGQLARIALFNFVSDSSGENAYTAVLTVSKAVDKVFVKYLLAESVSVKDNITWGGQTFGPKYTVDGRLRPSNPTIYTIECHPSPDQISNECRIQVPAPSFVLVSLPSFRLFPYDSGSRDNALDLKTFSTSTRTRTRNTATVDPSVLATSNGGRGVVSEWGSTGKGKDNGSAKYTADLWCWVVLFLGQWLLVYTS